MKAKQLEQLGFPAGQAAHLAKWLAAEARKSGMDREEIKTRLAALAKDPDVFRGDALFGQIAEAMANMRAAEANARKAARRETPAPWKQWGEGLEAGAVQQMRNACALPVSVAGALMPDAHVGYGLPIGGVLATRGAVVPYAVGVDIACRMKLTVLDLPVSMLRDKQDALTKAIEDETRFGVGAEFGKHTGPRGASKQRREHEVLDEDWTITRVTRENRDKAHAQLGTSGSGNHFVEFGVLTVDHARAAELGLPWEAGAVDEEEKRARPEGTGVKNGAAEETRRYLALLSHSGSRGAGAAVASYYSNLAMRLHPELDKDLRHLAWLDLDRAEGQEYWAAMNLMGRYAAANHAMIHRWIAKHLGAAVLLDVENHHNFAWEETIQTPTGEEKVIVHRKGATPAGAGVMGIIPGSMASPGYLVRGKGSAASLNSASHGAGRVMSRTQARNTYRWQQVRDHLERKGVTVISAGIDEVPFVYKDIHAVMAAQSDLV